MKSKHHTIEQIPSGISGLDTILRGGLGRGRTYLIEGCPGTGKTTLALQFLLEGIKRNERVMLVSLIETREELVDVAHSHGWSLDKLEILDLPQHLRTMEDSVQTLFSPKDVDFSEITETIIKGITDYTPDRLVIDSISQLSILTDNWFQLRHPILKLRDIVQTSGCTALFTSNRLNNMDNANLETIVHGMISLNYHVPSYGKVRREMIVNKMRGIDFMMGHHNYCIKTGGIELYLWPKAKNEDWKDKNIQISSGIDALDEMLGGGLEQGTACLVSGSTGVGKSTLASLYVQRLAQLGKKGIIFCFDERRSTFLHRCRSLNMPIVTYIENGQVDLRQVDVGELSPGEFAHIVRKAVMDSKAKAVIIDSITGYLSAMPEETLLMPQLHELLTFLGSYGVLTLMVISNHRLIQQMPHQVDASYIADTVVALRKFESEGEVRRCVTVVKKRHGDHEHTIREWQVAQGGCRVGPPLVKFTQVLSEKPLYNGNKDELLSRKTDLEPGE